MSLLVLSYHRARAGIDGNSPEMLDAHFECVAATCANVLPGEPLPSDRLAVCLCFNGGFYDFHATVFPLLRKHRLRALLAVSPAVVRDHTTVPPAERLASDSADAYTQLNTAAFCTWNELEELVHSDHVVIAAHGYTHRDLDHQTADLDTEIHVPRTLIRTRLRRTVDSFVFPHGRWSEAAVAEARVGYRYVFGGGDSSNVDWSHRVISRVCADNMRTPSAPFENSRLAIYRARSFWHRLRTS